MADTTFIDDLLLGTSTATEAQYNEQIAALLSEGTGTTITVGQLTPTPGSNKLSWGEVKRRLELGLPINEGELLPDIPEGITSTSFYNHAGFPGGANMFSQPPFSSFEGSVANPIDPEILENGNDDEIEAARASVLPARTREFPDNPETDADEAERQQQNELDSIIQYGPDIPFASILAGAMPFGAVLSSLVGKNSPFSVMGSVIGDFFSGETDPQYEPYARLQDANQAFRGLQAGVINDEQYNAFLANGPGKYYSDGSLASGQPYERRGFVSSEEYGPFLGESEQFGKQRTIEQIISGNRDWVRQKNSGTKDGDQSIHDPAGGTGLPQDIIGWHVPAGGDKILDAVGITASGRYWTPQLGGYINHLNFDPRVRGDEKVMWTMINDLQRQRKEFNAGTSEGGQDDVADPANTTNKNTPGERHEYTSSLFDDTLKDPEDIIDEFFTSDQYSLRGVQDREGPGASHLSYGQPGGPYGYPMEPYWPGPPSATSGGVGKMQAGQGASDSRPAPGYEPFQSKQEGTFPGPQGFTHYATGYPTQEGYYLGDQYAPGYQTATDYYGPQSVYAQGQRNMYGPNFWNPSADVAEAQFWDTHPELLAETKHQSILAQTGVDDLRGEQRDWENIKASKAAEKAAKVAAQDFGTEWGATANDPAPPSADYTVDVGGGQSIDFSDVGATDWDNYQEGGEIPQAPMPMPPPEGAAPMPMPQEGAAADMANLGMVNEQAAPPQNGGQQSVQDDVPREADEGDYILPYETVLMIGLKQLNRYAREAIKLAMKNDIDLTGTDLDPTDDVPIKVSNYEFHIPKVLVPFFGGGKKYLDKIRDEGLALRKRLEEEQQPSAEQQQPQATAQPAPPQLEAAPAAPPPDMAPPPQAGPPMQPPMMQKGGFVLDPNEGQQPTPTTAAVLEGDTSQQATAYNQLKALQRSKKAQQQPPMVDPTGKIIPQGFAAPQGYQMGSMVEDPEVAQAAEPKTEPPMPDWANRALDPKTPVLMDEETGEPQTLGLITDEINKMFHVYPTIRMVGKELKRYDQDEALSLAMKKKDSVKFKTQQEADSWSTGLVDQVASLRDLQQPSQPELVEPLPVAPPPMEGGAEMPPMPVEEGVGQEIAALEQEEEAMPPLPVEEQAGFAQQPMIA